MKQIFTLLIATITLTFVACNKETPATQTEALNNMLASKTWYLDFIITGTSTKSYLGQSTYFVTYLKDGATKDSDGLIGNYKLMVANNQFQIHVQVTTANGNPLEVVYDIISVGGNKLVLSKQVASGTPTQLYFTNK